MGDFLMIHVTDYVIDLVKNAYPLPALLRKDCVDGFYEPLQYKHVSVLRSGHLKIQLRYKESQCLPNDCNQE